MWQDPIVEEVRRWREEYAAKFNFDLRAIWEDLRAEQEKHKDRVVRRSPRPVVQYPAPKAPSMPPDSLPVPASPAEGTTR